MQKSLPLFAALGALGAAALTLPAIAQSARDAVVTSPGVVPLDLGSIPAKPVTGPLAVQGPAIDDEDDSPVPGQTADGEARAAIETEDEGRLHEDGSEVDD